MSIKEHYYLPNSGLLRPDVASSASGIEVREHSQFPTEQKIIVKEGETAAYVPLALFADINLMLQWMQATKVELPFSQTEGTTTLTLLQMFNESGGLLYVQGYFGGQKVNYRHEFAQFSQSERNGWGIQIGTTWQEFPMVIRGKLQELWVQQQAWQELTEAYNQAVRGQNTQKPERYLPDVTLLRENEKTETESKHPIVDILTMLNSILVSEDSGGLIYANNQEIHLTYFLLLTPSAATDLSKIAKLSSDLSNPFIPTEFERIKKDVIHAIQKFIYITYDVNDPFDLENCNEYLEAVNAAFIRVPSKISIHQETTGKLLQYRISFNF